MKKIKSNLFENILEFILFFTMLLLSIKKFGFYKTDVILCAFIIISIFVIYQIYCIIKKHEFSIKKVDIVEVLLLLLSLSYIIPVFTNNYANLSSSIDYFIRYFCMFAIYILVNKSSNKKMYIYSLMIITLFQCFFSLDQIGNRFLEKFLKLFNSGYISNINLDRMSGTIQYANVFALMCSMCSLLLLNKLLKYEISNNRKECLKISLMNLLFFIYTSSIILSYSKAIIILFIVSALAIILKDIKNKININKYLLIFIFLLVITYSSFIEKYMSINKISVYYISLCHYIFILIFSYIYTLLYERVLKINKKIKESLKNNKVLILSVQVIMIVAIITLIFTLRKEIYLNSESTISNAIRNIYDLKIGKENNICIKIEPKVEDTRYNISVLAVDKNFNSEVVKEFNYYSRTDDNFEFSYIPKEEFNYLIINITCSKGKLNIEKILVNDKSYIDYLLLPSDVIYRLSETLKSNLSINDRYYFYKDAIKIITSSAKNFLFGIGAQGYKDVSMIYRSANYSSTQVHSSILQIFVESGIIGFLLFVICIFFVMRHGNNNIVKLILAIFLIHSLIDVSFSYSYNLCLLGIIFGLLFNDKFYINTNINVIYIKNGIYVVIGISLMIILLRQNIAYYYNIRKYNEDNIKIETIKETIEDYEKVVSLDPFENNYRKDLNECYISLINEYKQDMQNADYGYTIKKLNNNVINMLNNERFNMDIKMQMSNIIVKYLNELVHFEYENQEELGYEYYLNVVYNNVDYVDKLKYNNYANEMIIAFFDNNNSILENYYINTGIHTIKKYLDMLKKLQNN